MFCTHCGAQLPEKAVFCAQCGVRASQDNAAVVASNDDAALRLVIPIGRSGWSIAAGYLGLLSLIPFVGVLAILIGIIAVRDIKKHPEKHGLGRAWFGIVMGALTLIVHAIMFYFGSGI